MILRRMALALMVTFGTAGCEQLEDEPIEQPEPPDPPDPPDPVDPVKKVGPISEITPRIALAGQKLTVTIKIGGDPAGPGSDVQFGEGIDVIKAVEVPGGLAVDIAVEDTAVAGPRNVTVLPDDAPLLTALAGFRVGSAIEVAVADGKPEQGGLVRLNVTVKDGKTLAGATFGLEPVVDPGVPSLAQIARGTFTTTTGSVVMLGDPLAKTGLLSLFGMNNPSDDNSDAFFASDALTVAARAPVPLTSGAASDVTLSAPLQTAFYSVDLAPAGGEGLLVDAYARKPGGSTLDPVVYGYGASGSSEDLLDMKRDIPFSAGVNTEQQARIAYPVTTATKGFFTVLDRNLVSAATSTLSFDYKTYRASIIAETAAPHGISAKQDIGALPLMNDAVPGRIITGNLSAAGEIDAYQFTVPVGAPFRNVQVSVVSEAEVDIIIDHVPNFDDDTTTFSNLDRATSGLTADFPDSNRYIRISATPSATKLTGKYTLGIRVVN